MKYCSYLICEYNSLNLGMVAVTNNRKWLHTSGVLQLISSRILINAVSMTTHQMQLSDYCHKTYARATEYLFNLFHLVISFKIPGIKHILEQICQKWKCESIQSASCWLKVCLTLFISVVIIRTAIIMIMNCLHTCLSLRLQILVLIQG